jgi:hypothetical protein
MQALAVPVLKSTLFAAVAVAALAVVPHHRHHHHHHRLVLHAEARPHALYLTQWQDGPVDLDIDADQLKPLRFVMRAEVSDGCRWEGVETLTPSGDHRYAYAYDERKLSCVPNPIPTILTPRTGWVEVQ